MHWEHNDVIARHVNFTQTDLHELYVARFHFLGPTLRNTQYSSLLYIELLDGYERHK